jgi:hypothetical protein
MTEESVSDDAFPTTTPAVNAAVLAAQNLKLLPNYAFAYHPMTNLAVKLQKGESGYTPLDTLMDPEAMNDSLNISKAQAAAMLAGSLFGWHTAAANPASYDEHGRPLRSTPSRRRQRESRCPDCGELNQPRGHLGCSPTP